MVYICLIEPEIPQNTGNIARTCAATGATLVLVHPLGFDISEKSVKRAGLDYWKDVRIEEYESKEAFFAAHEQDELYLFSARGRATHSEVHYQRDKDIYLVFGKESVGLEEELIKRFPTRTVRIPMLKGTRCLNLSNCAAIALYEVLRQQEYQGFQKEGELYFSTWEETDGKQD